MDTQKEYATLMEAYNAVYENQEQLDETRTDPRGRPASGPMSVYGGKGGDAGPGGSGNENVDRMDAAQRRVKRTQHRDKGMAADALFTRYSGRQRGTGSGENPSPSDRTEKGHPHSPKRGGRKGLGAETDRGSGNAAQRRMREDFDLFDYLLEYLVAEGYADTNKAALAIMANMSEEWKEEIMEGVRPGNVEKPLDKAAFKKRRRSLAGREASADARSRGHVDRLTGKPYSTAEAASRRKDIHKPEKAPEREARRRFGENPY